MSEDGSDQITIRIDEKLVGIKTHDDAFIFKVYEALRRENKEAYEPEMLSVGPYHRGKENLQKMEKYKLKYLKELLKRRGEKSAQRYIVALVEVEEEARNCYAEDISLSRDDFVEMMLLDGCFIIEFLRKHKTDRESWKGDPIFSMGWLLVTLRRDLLLFENQLPFFVLLKLFEKTKTPGQQEDLIRLAISCLDGDQKGPRPTGPASPHIYNPLRLMRPKSWASPTTPAPWPTSPRPTSASGNPSESDNTLRLMRPKSWASPTTPAPWPSSPRPTSASGNPYESDIIPAESDILHLLSLMHESWCSSFKKRSESADSREEKEEDPQDLENMKSACELKEHGIKFRKANQSTSWLDIKYEDGALLIPTLEVDDPTESLLRNLVAYEAYVLNRRDSREIVTDYIRFMDCLVNSSNDVKMLRHEKIIDNFLGNDEVVSDMFNKICNNVLLSRPQMSTYSDIFMQVYEHCSRRRYRWIAELKRSYFNNPWSIIAFLAATFLLLLTLIQTIFSII